MSIKAIAQITGLSTTTVSHAINGTRPVSEQSRKLIADAIEKTGYKPNLAAQMLKTQRSKTVALIMPSTSPNNSTNTFFFNVITGAKDELQEMAYELIISTYSESCAEGDIEKIPVLKKHWVDGVLLVPDSRYPRSEPLLKEIGLPMVLLDRKIDGLGVPTVSSDNESIVEEAVKLLFDGGKRRIAYLGGPQAFSTSYERYRGYAKALLKLGLPLDQNLLQTDCTYTISSGYRAAQRLLDQGADAIFSANSMLTMGLIKYLNQQKIFIPSEVALIGFDDYDWTEIVSPPVTAIRQDSYKMGRIGAQILLSLIDGKVPALANIVIPSTLTLRRSHGLV